MSHAYTSCERAFLVLSFREYASILYSLARTSPRTVSRVRELPVDGTKPAKVKSFETKRILAEGGILRNEAGQDLPAAKRHSQFVIKSTRNMYRRRRCHHRRRGDVAVSVGCIHRSWLIMQATVATFNGFNNGITLITAHTAGCKRLA